MQIPLPRDGRHRPLHRVRGGQVGRTRVAATVLLAAVLAAVGGVALTAAGASAGAETTGPAAFTFPAGL